MVGCTLWVDDGCGACVDTNEVIASFGEHDVVGISLVVPNERCAVKVVQEHVHRNHVSQFGEQLWRCFPTVHHNNTKHNTIKGEVDKGTGVTTYDRVVAVEYLLTLRGP